MDDILQKISEYTAFRIKEREKTVPLEELRELSLKRLEGIKDKEREFPFEQALKKEGMSFICECKKASPSKGLIEPDFNYIDIAKEYERAGASAISVLTEPKWFLGDDGYLKEISENVGIPCLRKDFTVSEYMIYEAFLLGAKAVLLIASILDDEKIGKFLETADSLGMSALCEAHSPEELKRLESVGARIIGVNNRNLRDFSVDINNSLRLRSLVKADILFVAESGIKTREDIKRLEEGGVNGVLIGETLMRARDKKKMLDELRG